MRGPGYLLRGLGLWRTRPGLMLLGMVPALLVLLLVLGGLVVLLLQVGDLVAWATPFAADWGSGPRALVRVALALLVVVGFLVVASMTFTALALTLGDPFYARIWAETEQMLGGDVPDAGPGFWRSAVDGLVLAGSGLLLGVGVLVLGLLPVVGTVVGLVLGVAVSGRLLAAELVSRALEARGMDRATRAEVLRRDRGAVLGFGVATQLCFLVPLGAVAVMPAAVAGATMLARDLLDRSPRVVQRGP
ncbi:MAG: EI24 domain-containing protein [Actinomycetota bacterium]|nr:EI24 domain-containing protein [Actinomycetota bacterium]